MANPAPAIAQIAPATAPVAHPATVVDPHAIASPIAQYLGFSPWWLLLGVAIVAAFTFYAFLRPEQFEAGASKERSLILGLRSGAFYSAAALGLVSLAYTTGFYWYLSLIIVCGSGVLSAAKNFHDEVYPKVRLTTIVVGELAGLAVVTAINFLWVLGLSTAFMSVVLGLIGGVAVGGFLLGGGLMDFFQNIGTSPKQHFTSDSAVYGVVTAFAVVTIFTVVFGALSGVATMIVSLLAGGAAGYLTAKGKYLAHETRVEALAATEENQG